MPSRPRPRAARRAAPALIVVIAAVLPALTAVAPAARADSVLLFVARFTEEVDDFTDTDLNHTFFSEADLPAAGTGTAALDTLSSTGTYAASNLQFDATLAHARQAGSAKSTSFLSFRAGESLDYSMSAAYAALDAGDPGTIQLSASILDVTTDERLFFEFQSSGGEADANLTLGGGASTQGSLAGTLLAGHIYEVTYLFSTFSTGGTVRDTTANGTFALVLTPRTPVVPLPTAAWGGMALFGAIGGTRALRRGRREG